MNISFIALNISGAETVQSAADNVRGILSSYGRCDFKLCGSMQQVSVSLSDAFSNADIVAVGVEPSVYCKSKLAILRAMHIKTQLCDEIKKRIGDDSGLDSKQLAAHCAMPLDSRPFLSHDGMFAGFALKSGKQQFLLLPLDKLRLDSIIAKGLAPYFDECGIVPQESPQDDDDTAGGCISTAAKLLRQNGKKVYFAATPSCKMVKSLCSDISVDDVFVFGTYSTKRGNEAPKSYIADLARYSIPQGENCFGAAISNVFTGSSSETGEQKYNVYVAVADSAVSRVLRFVSEPGETPEEMVTAAAEMLMEMLCDKCREIPSVEPDKSFDTEPIENFEKETEEIIEKKKHAGVRSVIFTLLALLLAFAVLFIFKGYMNANSEKAQAQNEFEQYAAGAVVDNGAPVIDALEFEITVNMSDWASQPSTQEDMSSFVPSTDEPPVFTTLNLKTTAHAETIKSTTAPKISTTAKKVTTTAKPTTTRKPTTSAAATSTKAPAAAEPTGDLVFTVYGYGHGVGMSQEGAIAYSKQGWSYDKILSHYYPGTVLNKGDPNQPASVSYGGVNYPLVQYLCCSVAAEIGPTHNSATREAVKAQAVAIYTYAKRNNFKVSESLHAFRGSFEHSGTLIESAVKEVLGHYLSYKGQPISAAFFAMSAGKTTKASTVWYGGASYPYLEQPVDSSVDKQCGSYKTTYTISAKNFKALMKANIGVELTGNPADWVVIVSHDGAASSTVGYVTKMTVGGKSISGAAFRNTAMDYRIRSHCFTVKYAA